MPQREGSREPAGHLARPGIGGCTARRGEQQLGVGAASEVAQGEGCLRSPGEHRRIPLLEGADEGIEELEPAIETGHAQIEQLLGLLATQSGGLAGFGPVGDEAAAELVEGAERGQLPLRGEGDA